MSREIATERDDFAVRNGAQFMKLLQRARHVLVGLRIELPQLAFAPLDRIGNPGPTHYKKMVQHVADSPTVSQFDKPVHRFGPLAFVVMNKDCRHAGTESTKHLTVLV